MNAAPAQMSPDELAVRLNQQELVAHFGLFALAPGPLQRLLDEACRAANEGLGTGLAKVLHYRPATGDFVVAAGLGWHAGVVGNTTLGGSMDSPAGFALLTGQPTLANHLATEKRFRMPAMLAEHGVQSAINVVIGQPNLNPFGVLEVDSTRRHDFVQADITFLQGLANVLAAGLARVAAEEAKDSLLRDKDLLMREVHHRVKNSLQLVRTMLSLQTRNASDETREQLENAAARIMSIAAVHRRLYDGNSVAEADAGLYLRGLLDDMEAMLGNAVEQRPLELYAEPMTLPADSLTPLGLIVSELVTNAVKHGKGRIAVQAGRVPGGLQVVVEDEGVGFPVEFQGLGGLGMRLIVALARGKASEAIQVDRSVPHGRIMVKITL